MTQILKKSCWALLFTGIFLSCSVTKHTGEGAVNWKKIRVFVYTKNGKGYVHDNIPSAVACIERLGNRYGFSVDVSDNPGDFSDNNLKKYNALIFTSTNNEVFDNDAEKLAMRRYIEAGGGFVGIHSVTGTERHWPWFIRMVGGTFVRHARHQQFKQIIVDTLHPSTAFLPRIWECNDECYYVTEINPDIHVLAVHDLTSVNDKDKPNLFGNVFPSVWCHEFDGGREWYTALGHDSATYSHPDFERHILGGIQWVIGENRPLDYSKAYAKTADDPLPY